MDPRSDRHEQLRQRALESLHVLDTEAEPDFDALARAAAAVCSTPIGIISLVDRDRQWFKANHGLHGCSETSREVAFCAHTVRLAEPLVVPDALQDPRFADNPLVVGEPGIRCYFGAPILVEPGLAVGSLCAIDTVPREPRPEQLEVLVGLAGATAALLQARRVTRELAQALEELELLRGLVPMCSYCRRIEASGEQWVSVEEYLHRAAGQDVTHGICPTCLEKLEAEL